jgi:NTE family protein
MHAVRDRRLPRVGALLAGLLPAGTVSGEPWLAPLRLLWEGRDWPPGMRIAAVRLRDGVRVVFDQTTGVPVADAVAASSAVPAYMAPIVIGAETYVDGSAHAPTNADLLGGEPLDIVVISAPMSAPPEGGGLGRDTAVRVWAARHARSETAGLVRAGVRVVTIAPNETARAALARRGGSVDERRAIAAKAAYAQVLDSGEALAAALR